jgi:3-deoxy-D-arabino-heptulosonate 7-phosphate (DAHP) synthase
VCASEDELIWHKQAAPSKRPPCDSFLNLVAAEVAQQIAAGEHRITGVMIESHLNEGRQDLVPGIALQ